MKYYRNLSEYLEEKHQTRGGIMTNIAEAALTILMYVDARGTLDVSDIMKLSAPLQTLFDIVEEVNEDVSKVNPESV